MEAIPSLLTSRAGFSPDFCGDLPIDEVVYPIHIVGG
jgi:hypothetical protein